MKERGLFLFLIFLLILNFNHVLAASNQNVDNLIKHAETYYWLGLKEKGNITAFNKGLQYLQESKVIIINGEFNVKLRSDYLERITSLQNDINYQIKIAKEGMVGLFPLTRFFKEPLIFNTNATETFELFNDPEEVAVNSAVTLFSEKVLLSYPEQFQFHVVVNSFPENQALENEALNVFSKYPKFFIHNSTELISSLPPSIVKDFRKATYSPEVLDNIFSLTKSSNLLLVSIRKLDEIDDVFFYEISGSLFQSGLVKPVVSFFQYGLCRDRRPLVPIIILINFLLFSLSVIVFKLLVKIKNVPYKSISPIISTPLIGFLIGRFIPWAVCPFLEKISPGLDSYAALTFWWPCLVGAILLLLPLLIYRFVLTRPGILPEDFKPAGHIPGAFMASALGTTAYFTSLGIIFYANSGILLVIPWTISSLVIGYYIGRSLDSADPFPLWLSLPSAAVSLIIGGLFSLADFKLSVIFSIALILAAFFSASYMSASKQLIKKKQFYAEEIELSQKIIPSTEEELIRRIAKPSFVKLSSFDLIMSKVENFFRDEITYIGLCGPSGIGKTTAVRAVLKEIQKRKKESKKPVILLCGQCLPDSTGIPFQPFQKAFADHFGIDLGATIEGQYKKLESSLGQLINNIIPFSSLLFPSISEDTQRHSNLEIFKSVSYLLKSLIEKNSIVLFIDDLQWIDQPSLELIFFLRDEFVVGDRGPLLFIFTTRDEDILTKMKLEHSIIQLPPTNVSERIQLLSDGVGLSKDTAEAIAKNTGILKSEKGELYWLLLSVDCLAKKGAFLYDSQGWYFNPEFLKACKGNLPLPQEFRSAIKEALKEFPDYLWIIECASCIGLEFDAHTLADSLSIPRLELLKILKEIEEKTGFIIDLRETDDYFAFNSSFLLQALREELQIKFEGPKSKSVPKLVREFHARIARAKEQKLSDYPLEIFAVAKHYYAAGTKYARKAIHYCRKAAVSATKLLRFYEARSYLSMAEECAEAANQQDSFYEDRLKIMLQEAHVTGSGKNEAFRAGLEHFEKNPNISISMILMIARACYEAGEFDKTKELAERVLKNQKATDLEKAEAYHFLGLSLDPSDRNDRIKNLRESLNIINSVPESSPRTKILKALVLNSLAEILSYGDDADRHEALSLFEQSIKIKSQREFHDLPGLARSYGGLGRLYLNLGDIEKARQSFERDLEISRQIGDLSGQMIMLSLIGKCHLKSGNTDFAITNYNESLEIANRIKSTKGQFYAALGLLDSYCILHDQEKCEFWSHRLIDILSTERYADTAAAIKEILEIYKNYKQSTWYRDLEIKIKEF